MTRVSVIGALLLAWAAAAVWAQEPSSHKNVLALYWYAREYPTNVLYEQGLLRALRADARVSTQVLLRVSGSRPFSGGRREAPAS